MVKKVNIDVKDKVKYEVLKFLTFILGSLIIITLVFIILILFVICWGVVF